MTEGGIFLNLGRGNLQIRNMLTDKEIDWRKSDLDKVDVAHVSYKACPVSLGGKRIGIDEDGIAYIFTCML